jgi:hypothetical protein
VEGASRAIEPFFSLAESELCLFDVFCFDELAIVFWKAEIFDM